MRLKSNDFNDYYFVPKTCGYRLGNKVPSLYVEGVPENATDLALVVYDPDVSYGELTHWLVWNLPVDIGEFTDNNLPPGAIQGTNDMGTVGYYGPTFTNGLHHIHFLIFALNIYLPLDSGSNRLFFDSAVRNNFIDHASLIGMYQQE
jgi:Raf kinase inhibitor-like YbhB/YbcL family protein